MPEGDAWDYHVFTGNSAARARDLLDAMPPDLRVRVMLAIQQKSKGELLVDPIESDPLFAERVRSAAVEAKRAVELTGRVGRGCCHAIWTKQKEILAERYSITWFSPKDMNPGVLFD